MIDDGVNGLLFERRNADDLAGAIATLLRNRELRAEMGARAREKQRHDFDLEAVTRRLESLYESLFSATARGRAERRESSWIPSAP